MKFNLKDARRLALSEAMPLVQPLPRLLYETLHVACFPAGVRSAQVGYAQTSSVQVPNAQ
ncbi:hypothetical protein [Nostoc sp.]|uniref:hypothetical protein n=1 Tax=Nostoc sp. TaxID=1180 RepID=UPI002FFC7DE7